jgi:GT2 family glycosyltransferase
VSEPITIVIPHYRAAILGECLESLFAHSDLPIRVIVVDDGPDAPSIQQARKTFPQIEILRNERNLGFCASCNRGLLAARSRYVILLNDDTRVTPNWLGPLVQTAESNSVIAACQPKLLSPTDRGLFDYGGGAGGYIDRLGYTFCRGRIFDHCEKDEGQYEGKVPLFWACGSALFLRLEAARQVGLLDPDYIAHFEEIDLCWRLQLAGYRIVAVPTSVVYHHSGFSLPPSSLRKNYLNHRNNLVLLYKNAAASQLLWLVPVRLALEALATLGYVLKRQWHSVLAPLLAVSWCLVHPRNLQRRRRHSQSLRQAAGPSPNGIYHGSILFQYFARRVRSARCLMPEEIGP